MFRGRGRHPGTLVVLAALTVLAFLVVVASGSVTIPLPDVVRALAGSHGIPDVTRIIVREVRLPRAITAALAGAGLGVAGLQMQTLFRNPLADPFVLGVSSGASLGVAAVVLSVGAGTSTLIARLGFLGDLSITVAAAVGAAGTMVVVLVVSRRVRTDATVLIVGLMVGYVVTAVVSMLVYVADDEAIRNYIAWTLGSFRGTTWDELRILAPVVAAGVGVAAVTTKQLDALLLGDRYAATMGVSVRRARSTAVVAASVLAGAVTAFCGPIGFLGIAAAHIARSVLGTSSHRLLVPATVLVGALTALAAEAVAQLPGRDQVLPINVVTALLGAPIVIVILLRARRLSATLT